MAYLTVDEAKNSFLSLRTDINDGKISEEQVSDWISSAEDIINLYVGKKYKLPLESECPLLTTLARELFHFFYLKYIYSPSGEEKSEDWLEIRYRRVISILEKIGSGDYPLLNEEGELLEQDPAKDVNPYSNTKGEEKIFKIVTEPIDWEIPSKYGGDQKE